MNSAKKFDFVVYGGTGFTGKLVVEYLVSKYGDDQNVSWAMAGRSMLGSSRKRLTPPLGQFRT